MSIWLPEGTGKAFCKVRGPGSGSLSVQEAKGRELSAARDGPASPPEHTAWCILSACLQPGHVWC
jgi:hypothetical protein